MSMGYFNPECSKDFVRIIELEIPTGNIGTCLELAKAIFNGFKIVNVFQQDNRHFALVTRGP